MNLEEQYWKILTEITKISDVKNIASFALMDTDAWIWGVRIYALILRDYCSNPPFDKDILRQYIVKTNHILSKHDQARKILTLLGIQDESEEGWWPRQFRRALDAASGKSGKLDNKRSFTPSERPQFLIKVKDIAQKAELTSLTLCLALIETAYIQNEEKQVTKILKILPDKAEE
ncbi:MAG: hypothetical protein HYZ69_00290, partial [Candidatus Colwellbacteria bacterium]|nr:hypothetical protein [Candidatus Colwellbacteria bacterium]